MLCALIMAGGKGTRFWPISTDEKPKQFLNLVGEDTMLQMTYKRIKKLVPKERIFICTGEKYVDLVKEQLPNIKYSNIIKEPESRNTAPCIVFSSLIISRYYKDADLIVLPSDHLITNEGMFIDILKRGEEFLKNNCDAIITLGIKPNRPECGYGYIKINGDINEYKIHKVQNFTEKPNIQKAKEYLSCGNYLWNAGMFIFNIQAILNKAKLFIPNTFEALKNIIGCKEEEIREIIDENYKKTDKISIDYAILEKDDNIYVIPSDIGWDDIGTWQAVERYTSKDENSNVSLGKTSYIDGANNIVISSGKQIVIDGLNNIYIIESKDKIIVGLKENIGTVKDLKEKYNL